MKNYVQPGKVLDLVLAANVASGNFVVSGELAGIAQTDGLSGATIAVLMEGVVTYAKATGAVTQGQKLYYVAANNNLSTTASGNTFVGYAVAAALSGDAEVTVVLVRGGI